MKSVFALIPATIIFLFFGCAQTENLQKDVEVILANKVLDNEGVDEYRYYYQVADNPAREIKAYLHKQEANVFITVEKRSATAPIKYYVEESGGASIVSNTGDEYNEKAASIDEAVDKAVAHYLLHHKL